MEYVLKIDSHGDDLGSIRQAANLKKLLAGHSSITVLKDPPRGAAPPAGSETRADPVTLTAIALAFFTSGAAKATVEGIRDVVKALIEAIKASNPGARTSRVHYVFKDSNSGREVEFDSEDLTRPQADKALEIEKLLMGTFPAANRPGAGGPA